MGKTVFNPITTKWRGAIGGFRYSVVRGNQVIAERASAVRNPRTESQMETRTKFKLSSQFSKIWADIIKLNLVKIERDAVLTRGRATKAAFDAAEYNSGKNTATVVLGDFANKFNADTMQAVLPVTLVFTQATQTITASAGDIVTYKIVAFDESDTPIGENAVTYTADGTAKAIDLPVIFGNASRYDIMVFTSRQTSGSTDFTGRLSNVEGSTDGVYSLFAQEVTQAGMEIGGILTGTYDVE